MNALTGDAWLNLVSRSISYLLLIGIELTCNSQSVLAIRVARRQPHEGAQ